MRWSGSPPNRLLRAVLGVEDAHELFGWLRGLSCIEAGPRGLYPHDLAREVLEADLRRRDDTGHRGLRDPIMADVFRRVTTERDRRQQEAIYDLFFQLRFDPVQRRYWQWETLGAAVPEPVGPADREAVLALVAAREGSESAALAARWLDRQPEGFTLYRTRGELGGVIGLLSLGQAGRADVQADPVTAAAWAQAAAYGPVGCPARSAASRRQLWLHVISMMPAPAIHSCRVALYGKPARRENGNVPPIGSSSQPGGRADT